MALLEEYGLSPSRSLGQNFLCDPSMIDKIVRLAGVAQGDRVVEIGPGLGSLTVGLIRAGAQVEVVEMDRFLIEPLLSVVGEDRVVVHVADALTLDYSGVHGGRGWTLVANLPYNVSVPLILDLLSTVPQMGSALVMVQKEVGERLAAQPGSKIYGIPSVLARYWSEARVVGSVPSQLFFPQPRVESVLVRLDRWDTPVVDCDFDRLARLVRAGFGQRRKMLRRSLAAFMTADEIETAGVGPTQRAEELTVEEWGALADVQSGASV